jgi:hypothetical protein
LDAIIITKPREVRDAIRQVKKRRMIAMAAAVATTNRDSMAGRLGGVSSERGRENSQSCFEEMIL